ncbi:MAG: metallophosphoesterase [Actinobacteria bacterium]|nr:metallophosphoesterase [Actinomycetota bacterium]
MGPFDATAFVRPSLSGNSVVHLAPFGTIQFDTHDAPLSVIVRVDELRLPEAQRIATNPAVLETLDAELASDARSLLSRLAMRALVAAILGCGLGALLAGAHFRATLSGAVSGALVVALLAASVAVTFDARAVREPRYTGLLSMAPAVVGDVGTVLDRFELYRAQLNELVGNVVTLYGAARGLPTFTPGNGTVRVLHVSDIHLNPQAFDLIGQVVEHFDIDAVADTGDITDWGTEPEARLLEGIGKIPVPYLWVRGNHDSQYTQAIVSSHRNAVVLDGNAAEVAGLRFWGIGDPRFTPDKDRPTGKDVERDQARAFAPEVAARLRSVGPESIDVALVHDSRIAAGIGPMVPLVLAGHTHAPREARVGGATLLVEGSTGGAGLRSLQGEVAEPLTCSVLYFDRGTRRLVAYDRITVQGLGETGARIERHVVKPLPARALAAEQDGSEEGPTAPGGERR